MVKPWLLPPLYGHTYPFERMIVWQAIQNNITLITKDKDILLYQKDGLKTLW